MSIEKAERNDRMERDYRRGLTLGQISMREQITKQRVYQILTRRGVTAKDRGTTNG